MKAPERVGTICEISWSDEGTPPKTETFVVGVAQADKDKTDIEHLFVTVEKRGADPVVALQLDEPVARCLFFLAKEVEELRGEVAKLKQASVVVVPERAAWLTVEEIAEEIEKGTADYKMAPLLRSQALHIARLIASASMHKAACIRVNQGGAAT